MRIDQWIQKPWREALTLGRFITILFVSATVIACMIAGLYTINILRSSKLTDNWAIMFLELEKEGISLNKRLGNFAKGIESVSSDNDVILQVHDDNSLDVLRGNIPGVSRLRDFNIQTITDLFLIPKTTIFGYGGEYFFAFFQSDQKFLILRKVPPHLLTLRSTRPAKDGAIYVSTKEGRVLFSNNPDINELSIANRPLVQTFIKAPIKQGQFESPTLEGDDSYGFFSEIPDTNMVFFSEIKKSVVMATIDEMVYHFLLVIFLVVLVVIVILQWPLSAIKKPLAELANLAHSVGEGKFQVKQKLKSYGELSLLGKAFETMAESLRDRDLRLAELIRENEEKIRLSSEIAIARRIQENLLPQTALHGDSNLHLASTYLSANECAGDWYQYYYDPDRRETIFVIADVSGHGAGSSIFTAVIAGLFDQARHKKAPAFPLEEFVQQTNASIFRLGKGEWHATMFIGRYASGSGILEFINAAHPAPIIIRGHKSVALKFGTSSILGHTLDNPTFIQRIEFLKDDLLFMFTDGLIEAARPDGKIFGRRRLGELLASVGDPQIALNNLIDHWRSYLGNASPHDDVCAIIVRAF